MFSFVVIGLVVINVCHVCRFQEAEAKLFENWPPSNEEFAVVLKLLFWQGFCSTPNSFYVRVMALVS